jgi:hypothetical protein
MKPLRSGLDWRNTAMDKVLGLFPRRTAEHIVNAQKEGILPPGLCSTAVSMPSTAT